VQAILSVVNKINPLFMFESHNGSTTSLLEYLFGLALAVACLVLAMIQWRRLEA